MLDSDKEHLQHAAPLLCWLLRNKIYKWNWLEVVTSGENR